MKRLYELRYKEFSEWLEERQSVGAERYGNTHLQRYNAVDVVEELLDAINITNKWIDRLSSQGLYNVLNHSNLFNDIRQSLVALTYKVKQLDKLFPDEVCTDERGGERIWWNDEKTNS